MEKYIICLKVNKHKIDFHEKFYRQFQKISDYLIKRKNLDIENYSLSIGMAGNDFIKNKITLKITYNLKK
jgi:hypothetical protein